MYHATMTSMLMSFPFAGPDLRIQSETKPTESIETTAWEHQIVYWVIERSRVMRLTEAPVAGSRPDVARLSTVFLYGLLHMYF